MGHSQKEECDKSKICLFQPIPTPAAAAAATYLTVRPSGGGRRRQNRRWAGIRDLWRERNSHGIFLVLSHLHFGRRQFVHSMQGSFGAITNVYPFAARFSISPRLLRVPYSRGLGRDLAKGFRTDLEAILIIFNMVQFRWHKLDCHHHLIVPIVSERGVK